ncbi:PAS domain S-box protein, partial [bacterium]|nr:PAS domain S-box protein [bacterium]MBU1983315.1 PAS domain S-box protein [bacterium]
QEDFEYVGREKYGQIAEKGSGTAETQWRRKDGTVIDILLSSSLIDPKNLPAGVTFTATDITERKRAEEQLRRSREEWHTIFHAVGHPAFILNPQQEVIAANRTALLTLGMSEQDVAGKKCWELFHSPELDAPPPGCPMKAMLASGEMETTEMEIEALGGHFLVSCTPVLGSDGQLEKVIHVATDVSELKRAETEVRTERDRAQGYLDIAGTIIVALNRQGEIMLINRKGCRILGCLETEIVGRDWFETCLPPPVRDAVRDFFRRSMEGVIEMPEYYENNVLTGNGERTIAWHNTVIRDDDERIIGTLSSGEDITERKQAEEELVRRTQELERSNSELERFAYVASHDLQEPLRMMSSYAELLKRRYEGQLDRDADDYVGYIVEGADRMQQLIRDLLAYSRMDVRGKRFEKIDCAKILEAVLENLQLVIEENQAVITHDSLPLAHGDKTQVVQLFQNLIGNAIKFRGQDAPRIHVGCADKNAHWEFSVSDNGIGIEAEYFDRIFVVFRRLHKRDEYPGTGIGLAICKKIVERHGGRIWVESQPGEGTTFRFNLPKSQHRDSARRSR